MSDAGTPGFLDVVATSFLRRRVHGRRLRVAAVRSLKVVSTGIGGGLRIDFDHTATYVVQATPWLTERTDALAAAPGAPAPSTPIPGLSIVIMVVGSRGDIQPFIRIGRRLATRHRVRIATHREFRAMVEQAGL